MVIKPEQERVRTLIADTVSLLCRNGLNYTKEFCIEGLLGITLDQDEVFLVNIKELVKTGKDTTDTEGESAEEGELTSVKAKKKLRRKRRVSNSRSNDSDASSTSAAQENASETGEPSAKNIKQEELDDSGDDLVFVKDEPGATTMSSYTSQQNFAQSGAQDSILSDMSQQGQLYATPTSDPLPGSSMWDPSQAQMYNPNLSGAGAGSMSSQQPSTPTSPGQQEDSKNKMRNSPWLCSICSKSFSSKTHLKRHIDIHNGIYPYSCDHCGIGMTNPVRLKEHMTKHTSINYFGCSLCSQSFRLQKHLKKHEATEHCKELHVEKIKKELHELTVVQNIANEQKQIADVLKDYD